MYDKSTRIFRGLGTILGNIAVIGLSSSTAAFNHAQAPATTTPLRQPTLPDADWMFQRGDISSTNRAFSTGYDDAQWQQIQLPHDYVLDGTYEFSEDRDKRKLAYQWHCRRGHPRGQLPFPRI